ncbi:Alpha/Beta hydrolase protein, partial [Thamnocephalis sphaerospora]
MRSLLLRALPLLALLATPLSTHLTPVQASSPGDVIIDMRTNNVAVESVDQLGGVLNNNDMFSMVQNWLKLISLLPFTVPEDISAARKCDADDEKQSSVTKREPDDVMRVYAKFAAASYCMMNSMVRSWTCLGHCKGGTEGTEVVHLKSDWLTQIKYYIAVNHRLKSIILSVRGTLAPINVLIDFSWVPIDYTDFPGAKPGAMVHAGFLVASLWLSMAVRDQLFALAERYSDYTVDFTGHSLGGAITQLVALNFAARTPIP